MDTLFRNGRITTLTAQQEADALLCRDGRIAAIGEERVVRRAVEGTADEIDLRGQRILPAFVDSHSHLTAFAQTLLLCDLGGATSFADIVDRLHDFAKENPPKRGAWLNAFGYDHNVLKEQRHPDRYLLDKAFPDLPVLLAHASGHMGVVNSAGLKRLGIAEDAPDPAGGHFGRDGDGRLTGYLEETAFTRLGSQAEKPDEAETFDAIRRAQRLYASYGILTTQDGLTRKPEWALLHAMAVQQALLLDVPCYLDVMQYPELESDMRPYATAYRHHLRIAGYKLFLDGSPQGRTAWLTKPYLSATVEEVCEEVGYPVHTDEEVSAAVEQCVRTRRQLLIHCNGDAAVDQLIRCCKPFAEQIRPLRFVVIHGQCLRMGQLPALRELGMAVSFFTAHSWYWGDVHLQNLGTERGMNISPANSALQAGVPVTFHQDTPVIRPNMLETMACAVERVTSSGVSLSQKECVTVTEALRAVTMTAAWQCFEEDDKGSLAVGKRADFIAISEDVMLHPDKLRRATVTQNWLGGVPLL